MSKDLDRIMDNLRKGIAEVDQESLFNSGKNILLEACVEYARFHGCAIKLPQEYPIKIIKLDDLIQLFYLLFQKNYPKFTVPYNSIGRDRKVAKLFVESRMAAEGINRTKALEQCASIIEAFYRYKSSFKFDPAPTFGVFGQGNMAWITSKLLNLMNKEIEEIREKETERLADAQTAKIVASGMQIGWSREDLDEAYKNRGKR